MMSLRMSAVVRGPARNVKSILFVCAIVLTMTISSGCAQASAGLEPAVGSHSMENGPVNAGARYIFYLHGRIIEDLGIHAVSEKYGPYQYEAILESFEDAGFVVISEPRPRNTDVMEYAEHTVSQIESLLESGVPPGNITVVGASKGAYIATLTSHLARNRDLSFVLLATCHPESVEHMKENQIDLWGNVLAIRDRSDWSLSGSCEDVFAFSEGIERHEEVVLDVGTGHGIVYKPLDEWVIPTIDWARGDADE